MPGLHERSDHAPVEVPADTWSLLRGEALSRGWRRAGGLLSATGCFPPRRRGGGGGGNARPAGHPVSKDDQVLSLRIADLVVRHTDLGWHGVSCSSVDVRRFRTAVRIGVTGALQRRGPPPCRRAWTRSTKAHNPTAASLRNTRPACAGPAWRASSRAVGGFGGPARFFFPGVDVRNRGRPAPRSHVCRMLGIDSIDRASSDIATKI